MDVEYKKKHIKLFNHLRYPFKMFDEQFAWYHTKALY